MQGLVTIFRFEFYVDPRIRGLATLSIPSHEQSNFSSTLFLLRYQQAFQRIQLIVQQIFSQNCMNIREIRKSD